MNRGKLLSSFLAALLAAWLLAGPALAQNTSDGTGGSSEPVPVVSGGENADVIFNPIFRTISPSGNQDWVRQYDRKTYSFLDLGGFRWDVLNKDTFFRVQLKDIGSGDWQSGNLFLDSRYVRFEGDYDALYHRTGITRQSRILNGQVNIARFDSPTSLQTEHNLAQSFGLSRNTKDFGLRIGPFNGALDRTSLRFNWWNQDVDGNRVFRTRAMFNATTGATLNPAGEHPTDWFAQSVSQQTDDISLGFDTGFGPVGLGYRFLSDGFNNRTPGITFITSANQGSPPGSQTTWQFPDFNGSGHNVLGSLRLSDWGSVYMDYLSKDRKNSFTGNKYDFSNLAAGFNARANDWLLSVNYNSFDRDTKQNPGYTVLFPTPNDLTHGYLNLDRSRLGFDVRYTGLQKYNFGFGYRTETSHRRNDQFLVHRDQEHEDAIGKGFIEEPNVWNPSSTKNTWYLHLAGYPTDWLDFRLDYRSTDANHDDFTRGVPGDNDTFTADVNLYPMDWWTVYANYQDVSQRSNQFLFRDNYSTWTLGTSVNPIKGLGLGLFYTNQDGHMATNYYWGGHTGGPPPRDLQFTPQLHAPYDYDHNTFGINALATLTEGLRLSSNYTTTTSHGTLPVSIFNTETLLVGPPPAIAPGLAGNTIPGWNPVNVDNNQLDIGLEWDLAKNQTFRFDYLSSDWKDRVLNYADGSYSAVWASWTGRW